MEHVANFLKKERTSETDDIIRNVNDVLTTVSNKRLGMIGNFLLWNPERRIYVGSFYSRRDDTSLLSHLITAGFTKQRYAKSDDWRVASADAKVEVAYFEETLYAKVM